MNLMISETSLQPTPAATGATHADVAVDILSYAIGESALDGVLVARSANGVCAILIGADHDELGADLAARFPQATLVTNEALVHADLAKVIRFVDKPAEGLHLTLDMRGTPLHRRVWEKLRSIGDLHGAGPLDQPPGLGSCDRWRLRRQSDRTGHSLPPRRPRRWRFSRLPLGHRTQARTDQEGDGIKSGHPAKAATRSYRFWGRALSHPTMRRERR